MQFKDGYPLKSSNHFVQKLYESELPEEKFLILEKEVALSGFDGVLYTFIPKLSRLTDSLQPVFQFSKSYTDLITNYQKNDFSRHDFLIRLVEEGKLDIIDWWSEAERINLTAEEEKVNKVAKEEFGITKGITFPTLSNDMGYAGISIISFKQDFSDITIEASVLNHLKSCSRMYHDHSMIHQDARYEFILPILNTLTPKKKLLIKYLISGKPMKNIADEADITTRYADKLLSELRKQFGNISKNELIYLLGLLNISEYL
jgi:DNA-binding CsgD family transcriptional regulator